MNLDTSVLFPDLTPVATLRSSTPTQMNQGAHFSECGNYRYKLWRIWDEV
jgi:hypothetical protein